MAIAKIKCDRTEYALPTGEHKGDNLRAFFRVSSKKDLWLECRDENSDSAVLVFGDLGVIIQDGDRFFTAHKEINGGD